MPLLLGMFIQPAAYNSPPATRIVSLVPSITELLADLHLDEETIAITKFCVHPKAWFQSKKRIGGTKNLHIDEILALAPDLVIANKEENVREQIMLLADKVPVLLTDVNTLGDALGMIRDVGLLTGKGPEAHDMIQQIEMEFSTWQQPALRPSVAYLIWHEPLMVAANDTYIHDMISQAGFTNCYGDMVRYPEVAASELRERSPDYIFLSTEPYPFTDKHVESFSQQFPASMVKLVDGEMFSWYGSRLLKAPAYFKLLHV